MSIQSAQIIAHRGASFDAPENTLESFRLGLEQGADALECDVHLSADGELVVLHDARLKRIAGVDRAVNELTLSELQGLDVGSWKAAEWDAVRIPTLGDVLDLLPGDRRLFIESKIGPSAVTPLKALLASSDRAMENVVLMDFDLDAVIAMKKAIPDAEVLWLNKFSRLSFFGGQIHVVSRWIDLALQHGLDGLNLQNVPKLNAELIQSCTESGLRCYCWTVDDPDRASELLAGGISGIATNRPGWMREQLGFTSGSGIA